ncbi:ABC transporter ATP-binding protein [Corynebacterium ulcerans]|nr:ABC transporter ATP-binding protein [Corynebacterium ulcerans NCTC 12077]STC80157.1 ABC transporter ATP-binding protein [Corynebacterium ulcerans]
MELSDVAVDIHGTRILSSVSFSASPGRVHAVLGPNGAGKSTTFKALLGLIPISTGSVRIFGEPLRKEHLASIGASINGPALYSHLTARENLQVHSSLLGLPSSEIDRVLSIVGLSDTGRKKTRAFSTGMKARLALAIALLGNPRILLLDEPQNGLDPQGIADLRAFLQRWAAEGNTVIVSSHQLGEIARLAHDITVIKHGTTLFSGPAATLANHGDLEKAFFQLTGEKGEH